MIAYSTLCCSLASQLQLMRRPRPDSKFDKTVGLNYTRLGYSCDISIITFFYINRRTHTAAHFLSTFRLDFFPIRSWCHHHSFPVAATAAARVVHPSTSYTSLSNLSYSSSLLLRTLLLYCRDGERWRERDGGW